ATDAGFFHLHQPEFFTLGDGDFADDFDHAAAIGDRPFAELFKGGPRGGNGGVGVVENAVAPAGFGGARGAARRHRPDLGQDLGDHAADQVFVVHIRLVPCVNGLFFDRDPIDDADHGGIDR